MQTQNPIYRVLALASLLTLLLGNAPVTAVPALSVPLGGDAHTGNNVSVQDEARVGETLGGTPLMFIENVGQFDEGARFQIYGGGRTIWLVEGGLWVTITRPVEKEDAAPTDGGPDAFPMDRAEELPTEYEAVHMKLSFPGANPNPRLEPFDRLDTHVSYFIGADPDQWQTDVPAWGGVRYVDLYPGVDLEITDEGWRLVCGGADCHSALRNVRLRVEGADAVELVGGEGEGLRLHTAVGDLTLPLLAVEGAVPDAQLVVSDPAPGTFEVASPFSLSHYLPHSTAQAQDNPDDLLYATFLGGSNDDWGHSITVDSSGSAYVSGYTESSDFPAASGPGYDTNHNGGIDAFVVKLNSSGTGMDYATFLGGSNDDSGFGIAVDGSGSAYVIGVTYSSDFPAASGPGYDTGHNGTQDAFVVKLGPTGSDVGYATFLGGSGGDYGYGIAVDSSGSAYVTGRTHSSNFPAASGPGYDTNHNGHDDAFVVKLNSSGTGLDYATFLGGGSSDSGSDIALDSFNNAYVTGSTSSGDFPAASGPGYDTSYNAEGDAFVVKLSSDGNSLDYATYLGGWDAERCQSIAVDSLGSAYVSGSTESSDFPAASGPGYDTDYNGGTDDAFVVKLSPDGTGLDYATFLGGSGKDYAIGTSVDNSGNAYVSGYTDSSNFPATSGPGYDTGYNGSGDAFVVKLNPSGMGMDYATFLGGSYSESGYDIALNDSGGAHVVGYTFSSDFPAASGPGYDTDHNGAQDVFVVKLALVGAPDTIPPATIDDLSASASDYPGDIILSWTAPGDDGDSGTASLYVVKYDTEPISENDWNYAFDVEEDEPTPLVAGSTQAMTVSLTPGHTYHFAIKAQDEVPNVSGLSNSASAKAPGMLISDINWQLQNNPSAILDQQVTVLAMPVSTFDGPKIALLLHIPWAIISIGREVGLKAGWEAVKEFIGAVGMDIITHPLTAQWLWGLHPDEYGEDPTLLVWHSPLPFMDLGVPHVITGTVRKHIYLNTLRNEVDHFFYLEVESSDAHQPSTTHPHYTIPAGYTYTYWLHIRGLTDYGEQVCTAGMVTERYPVGGFHYVRIKLLENQYPSLNAMPVRVPGDQQTPDKGSIALFCGTKLEQEYDPWFPLHPDEWVDGSLFFYLDTTGAGSISLLQGTQSQIIGYEPSSNAFWEATLGSPADIHIYDSEGNHVGVVYDGSGDVTGVENEIPDATYFYGVDDTPEFVSIANPTTGPYTITIRGTDTGTYTQTVRIYDSSGEQTYTSTLTSQPTFTGKEDTTVFDEIPAAPVGLQLEVNGSSINLNWDDNTESDLAGYNVYRSNQANGVYQKLNDSLLSASSFIDNDADECITCYYYATAEDTDYNESGHLEPVMSGSRLYLPLVLRNH